MGDFNYRILVVDDDEGVRRVSQQVLSRFGYEVRTAQDGFEALVVMRKALPDLIVSDLKMPNMSGFEFLSVVRRRFPHIPVVVISGEFVGAANPEGLLADAFFHKGQYSPEQLFREIQSLVERAPIRPHLPKPDAAPVWVPRNGSYVVLTCPGCLRSFSIADDEAKSGFNELPCVYCDTAIRFVADLKSRT